MTVRALMAVALAGATGVLVSAPVRAADPARYEIVDAFPHLEFHRPVDLQSARDGTNRLFVVEQGGMIHVFENKPGTRTNGVFLDIHERVNTDGNEMGMLGLAFHPDFGRTRAFFVDYTATKWTRRITRVARFTVGPYPNAADVPSE